MWRLNGWWSGSLLHSGLIRRWLRLLSIWKIKQWWCWEGVGVLADLNKAPRKEEKCWAQHCSNNLNHKGGGWCNGHRRHRHATMPPPPLLLLSWHWRRVHLHSPTNLPPLPPPPPPPAPQPRSDIIDHLNTGLIWRISVAGKQQNPLKRERERETGEVSQMINKPPSGRSVKDTKAV